MSSAPTLLQIDRLCFTYPAHKDQPAIPVFRDFDARIGPGVTLLCGDESCGKTSLLRLLAGELRPDSGHISLHEAIYPGSATWTAEVAFCDLRSSAHDAMYPANCFEGMRQQHPRFDQDNLDALIEGLELRPHLDKALYMLSTGTRRKIGLTAVLACGARLSLLDEPFAALDRSAIDFLSKYLSQANQATDRAWILATYQAPRGLALAGCIDLSP